MLRRLRVQRLPAPRSRPARVPRAAAAHRRRAAAAARGSGRRQHPRRRRRAGRDHRDARPRGVRGRRCGAVAFSWTDEWWRGGQTVDDWAFGLVDAARQPEAGAGGGAARRLPTAPFPDARTRTWPKVSVVVCAYNAADTLDDCLASLERAHAIPTSRSSSSTTARATRPAPSRAAIPGVRVIDMPNGGLSAARNVGLAAATGEIVAYTDADVRVDPDWLTYLVQPFLTSDVVGSGGPNVVPPDDPVRGAVRRARPGRPDARAARRSHRRARARLQHGVPPRRARSPSAGSTRSTCAPATTSTCAGGCRRRAADRVRAVGARLAPPPAVDQGATGASRSGTAKARRGSTRTIPRSSSAAACCGAAASTARCRSSARCRSAASTPASGERRHFRPSTRRACIQRNCCRIRLHGWCSRRSLSLPAQRRVHQRLHRVDRGAASAQAFSAGSRPLRAA